MSDSDQEHSTVEDDPLAYDDSPQHSQRSSCDEEDDESLGRSFSDSSDYGSESGSDSEEPQPKRQKRKSLKKSSKTYEWVKDSHSPPEVVKQNTSPTVTVKEEHISLDPLTIFYKYFDEPFIQLAVKLTNDSAAREGKNFELAEDELKAYFGMLIIMGFHKVPYLNDYWHSDQNLRVPRVSKIMSLRRFLDIRNYLCFSIKATVYKKGEKQETDFGQVSPLLDHLNEKFCQIRHPSQPLSIDESTVRPKNLKEQFRQSGEKHFSVLAVGCGKTGYIFRVNVRGPGKDFRSDCDNRVRDLMLPFEGLGHSVYVARKHSSFPLVEELYQKRIFACCELEQNDPNIPTDLRIKRLKMERGHFVKCGDFSITKWKDAQRHYAYILSTFHDPRKKAPRKSNKNYEGKQKSHPPAESKNQNTSRNTSEEEISTASPHKAIKTRNDKVKYPQVVVDYCNFKQGIGIFDHHRLKYSTSWKCYAWTKRLFYYMLDVTLVNSRLVYESSWESTKHLDSEKRLSSVEFRSELADGLIGGFASRKRENFVRHELQKRNPKSSRGIHSAAKNFTRLQDVGRHLPIKNKVRRCASCSMKGKEKRSTISCKECNVGLCIQCFVPFHTT